MSIAKRLLSAVRPDTAQRAREAFDEAAAVLSKTRADRVDGKASPEALDKVRRAFEDARDVVQELEAREAKAAREKAAAEREAKHARYRELEAWLARQQWQEEVAPIVERAARRNAELLDDLAALDAVRARVTERVTEAVGLLFQLGADLGLDAEQVDRDAHSFVRCNGQEAIERHFAVQTRRRTGQLLGSPQQVVKLNALWDAIRAEWCPPARSRE